jgi:hypothetical protein
MAIPFSEIAGFRNRHRVGYGDIVKVVEGWEAAQD